MIGSGLLARRAECDRFQSNAVKSREILSSILLHRKFSTLKSIDGVRKGRLLFVLPRGARRDPYTVLQIPQDSDLKTVKQAYRRLIRTVHPDVNKQSTAAQKTMEIISAYSALCKELEGLGATDGGLELDIFDFPEEQASTVFVNPFLCTVCLPCDYEALNEMVRNSSEDPEDLLVRNGVRPLSGAINYVTSKQAEVLMTELASIGPVPDTIALEVCASYIFCCLNRAQRANARFS